MATFKKWYSPTSGSWSKWHRIESGGKTRCGRRPPTAGQVETLDQSERQVDGICNRCAK